MTFSPEKNSLRPTATRMEAKGEATTKAARQILDAEASARIAKTDRLRAARLAQVEAAEAPAAPAKKRAPRKA